MKKKKKKKVEKGKSFTSLNGGEKRGKTFIL